mmetsp:Transcript_12272/g.27859  ORF Transcript_12272/g.27859 Transcript_12272/m.27859 type:complete len:314 (+) Transcript_12272:98-1039(+)
MEERQRCLLDQPLAVLRYHAEECGIDVASCIEKEELVRRIMQAEPAECATGTPIQVADISEDQQRRLQEDEQMARRLQAEEQARAETGSRDRHRAIAQMLGAPRGRGGGAGAAQPGGTGQREAIEGLLQQLQELRGRVPVRPRNDQRPIEFSNTGAEARQREALEEAAEHPEAVGGSREGGQAMLTPQSLAALFAGMGQEEDGGDAGAANRTLPLLAHLLQQLSSLQTGLDPGVVEQLTATTTYKATENTKLGDGVLCKCMVCLEMFKAGDELRILPCLHRFHKGCVDEWLARSAECPICKFNITTDHSSGVD